MGLFDIYSKEHRRIIMAKKISSEDKINDTTLHELLLMIDAKLNHLEDISADNRAIIVKLVKQSNQIVEFLRNLELEVQEMEYGIEEPPPIGSNLPKDKIEELKQLFDDFKSRKDELKEFEKELKRHKNKLTPGQVGDA
jgi:DNA repair exonuclease SbcCD ATPase subunit